MREIGGYFGFELNFYGNEYHKNAIALNLARNAIVYLAEVKKYQKIYIPYFLCDCMRIVLEAKKIDFSFYNVDGCCRPMFEEHLAENEAILIVNYYGQLSRQEICLYRDKWKRIIVDNTHAFFEERIPGIDTIYNARKYFGVADGGYLYTDDVLPYELEQAYSYDNMRHLVGRYEKSANEFYEDFIKAEEFLDQEPLKKMSLFSQNILRGVDYDQVRRCREENYLYLHKRLGSINRWKLKDEPGTYMYPFLIENGYRLRKKLQSDRIYIPVLWPNVLKERKSDEQEYQLSDNILPLPIDQRYTIDDMEYICKMIERAENNRK